MIGSSCIFPDVTHVHKMCIICQLCSKWTLKQCIEYCLMSSRESFESWNAFLSSYLWFAMNSSYIFFYWLDNLYGLLVLCFCGLWPFLWPFFGLNHGLTWGTRPRFVWPPIAHILKSKKTNFRFTCRFQSVCILMQRKSLRTFFLRPSQKAVLFGRPKIYAHRKHCQEVSRRSVALISPEFGSKQRLSEILIFAPLKWAKTYQIHTLVKS